MLQNADFLLVLPRVWPTSPEDTATKTLLTRELRVSVIPRLKALAPDSGAYINEADPSNPDWKHDYFGTNYDALLRIKREYDPNGLFWCKPCVGWDDWEIRDDSSDLDEEELGIGQGLGILCRKA